MLANAELAKDFSRLNQQFREKVTALLAHVDLSPDRLDIEPVTDGHFEHFDGSTFYLINSGSISACYRGRTVYFLEEGDMLLPDIAGQSQDEMEVYYSSEAGASLDCYPAIEFMQQVLASAEATRIWTQLMIIYAGMMLRLGAARSQDERHATPGFEIYAPGEVIIRQGDRADFVFNLSSGVAEVLVNDVQVGRIGEGEIFGAMAVLTDASRSATVRAKSSCAVIKVPKAQFTELIKSNPATIHSLLVDMANSIVNLNEQLVGLHHNTFKVET